MGRGGDRATSPPALGGQAQLSNIPRAIGTHDIPLARSFFFALCAGEEARIPQVRQVGSLQDSEIGCRSRQGCGTMG